MKLSPIILILFWSCSVNSDYDNRASIYCPVEVTDYYAAPGFYSESPTFSIKENLDKLLGFPKGGGIYGADNSSIITLGGSGGYIVVKFDPPIENLPDYYDFIVFGNTIWLNADPEFPNKEPGFVEVKQSLEDEWSLLIPEENRLSIIKRTIKYYSDTLYTWESTNDYISNIGYTEITPTLKKPETINNEDFYTVPDRPGDLKIDEGSGGGDAFKLEWAVDKNLHPVILDQISYVKITTGVYTNGGYTYAGDYYPSETEVDSIIRVKKWNTLYLQYF